MLTLGLAAWAETAERIREPLAERDIAVQHISLTGETTHLAAESSQPAVDAGLFFPKRLLEGGVLTARLDIPWVNDREAILRSRNKAETLARLHASDIPVPETVLVSDPVDRDSLEAAFDAFGPPIVVKPNSTTRGQGVFKVTDRDSLGGAGDLFGLLHSFPAVRDRSFLLQEFIPDARDLRVMVIDGTVVGAVERSLPEAAREAGQWKHNVHRGAAATGIEISETVRTLAERTADVLDVPILGVDLLQQGDRTVVLETNARPTIDDREKYDPDFYDVFAETIRKTAPE